MQATARPRLHHAQYSNPFWADKAGSHMMTVLMVMKRTSVSGGLGVSRFIVRILSTSRVCAWSKERVGPLQKMTATAHACMLACLHRLGNQLAPFKPNLLAGNIHGVLGKPGVSNTSKCADSSIIRIVTHGAPAALIKYLKAAKLGVAIAGNPPLGKSHITSTCEMHKVTNQPSSV